MNKVEKIKQKAELIKTKVELKKILKENKDFISKVEAKEIEKTIKEIEGLIKHLDSVDYIYTLYTFKSFKDAEMYIDDYLSGACEITDLVANNNGVAFLYKKQVEKENYDKEKITKK